MLEFSSATRGSTVGAVDKRSPPTSVLVLASLQGLFSGFAGFPLFKKPTLPNSNSDLDESRTTSINYGIIIITIITNVLTGAVKINARRGNLKRMRRMARYVFPTIQPAPIRGHHRVTWTAWLIDCDSEWYGGSLKWCPLRIIPLCLLSRKKRPNRRLRRSNPKEPVGPLVRV